MKLIAESYSEFTNEGFFDTKKFTSIEDVFNHVASTKGRIANSVMDIIMQEKGISEKNFKGMDIIKVEIEEVFAQTPAVIIAIVKDGEEEGKRVDHMAEEIYHKYFRDIKIDESIEVEHINEASKPLTVLQLNHNEQYYFHAKTKIKELEQWVKENIGKWTLFDGKNDHVEVEKTTGDFGWKIKIINNHTGSEQKYFTPYKKVLDIIKLDKIKK